MSFIRTISKTALLLISMSVYSPSFAADQTLTVTTTNGTSIQDAINKIKADPTLANEILLSAGVYKQQFDMSSIPDVTLRGEETARVFLDGDGDGPLIKANGVAGVIIQNITLIDADTGISATDTSDIKIFNCAFSLGSKGTAIKISDTNTKLELKNNTFYNNKIALRSNSDGDNLEIENNIFDKSAESVYAPDTFDLGTEAKGYTATFNGYVKNNAIGVDLDIDASDSINPDSSKFVDAAKYDFHLQADSTHIDAGTGLDPAYNPNKTKNDTADLGAYGGPGTDRTPSKPILDLTASIAKANTSSYIVNLSWSKNTAHLVKGYNIYYTRNELSAAQQLLTASYDGVDADDGAKTSPVDAGSVSKLALQNFTAATASAPTGAMVLTAKDNITPGNKSLTVDWTSAAGQVTGETGYKVRWKIKDSADNETVEDAGSATKYTIKGLSNGVIYSISVEPYAQDTYYFAVAAYDYMSAPNTNLSSLVAKSTTSVNLGTKVSGTASDPIFDYPETISPYPNVSGEGCFIATAAFGYYSEAHVQVLRNFRDTYLATNDIGAAFVHWYYRNGPTAAHLLNLHPELKPVTRVLLAPLIFLAAVLLGTTVTQKLLMLGLVLALAAVLRLRKRTFESTTIEARA